MSAILAHPLDKVKEGNTFDVSAIFETSASHDTSTQTHHRTNFAKMESLMKFIALCGFTLILQALYTRYSGGLSAIPGPPSASFCNIWKILAVYHNDMPRRNIAVHRKYGPVVRIGPKTISFSSPEALHIIHGSRQAYPKVSHFSSCTGQLT
jgi:hypothetical protein